MLNKGSTSNICCVLLVFPIYCLLLTFLLVKKKKKTYCWILLLEDLSNEQHILKFPNQVKFMLNFHSV